MLPRINEFFEYLQRRSFSDETIYNYKRDLDTFDHFLLNHVNISFENINRNIIKQFNVYLSSTSRRTAEGEHNQCQLSSYSINRILSAVRSYLKFLSDVDYKSPISADDIKLLKTEKKYGQVPEMRDLIKLIEAPTKFETDKNIALRNQAMLETLFATGMRISELLSLKKQQLDASGRIYIMGKGKKQRFVYLTPRAIRWLQNYLRTRKDDSDFMFVPYRGRNSQEKNKKISSNYLQFKIKRYRELLGINIPVSAHSIRHSFATYMAEGGANPAAIQILLGHESLDTTTRYVHASDRYAEKAHTKYHPLRQ